MKNSEGVNNNNNYNFKQTVIGKIEDKTNNLQLNKYAHGRYIVRKKLEINVIVKV